MHAEPVKRNQCHRGDRVYGRHSTHRGTAEGERTTRVARVRHYGARDASQVECEGLENVPRLETVASIRLYDDEHKSIGLKVESLKGTHCAHGLGLPVVRRT